MLHMGQASVASLITFACIACSFAFASVVASEVPKPILVTPLKLSDLPGRWTGVGYMEFRDGTSEQMNCRIIYRFESLENLLQKIWCKNRNIRLEVQAQIADRSGTLSGDWDDRIYSMSGKLRGQLHGNQIKAVLSGGFFNAKLNIMIIGSEQKIQLTPDSGQLRSMRIRLARG